MFVGAGSKKESGKASQRTRHEGHEGGPGEQEGKELSE